MSYFQRVPWYAMTVLLLVIVCGVQVSNGQDNFGGPGPNSIYKEFSRTTKAGDDWRITDPNVNLGLYPQAAPFLPNPTLSLSVNDLAGAVRAEAVLTIWSGHIGTTGKKIRFNNRAWINIPELGGVNGIPAGHSGQCYIAQNNVTIPVPLSDLVQGTNTFQGTNTGQTCYSFQWGQHGWYGIILRIYYSSSKAHPTGTITSPGAGSTFGEFPSVSASVSGGADRVDFLAFYDGFDTDGDGIYQEYHHDYMVAINDGSVMIKNHVGTVTGGGPYTRSWDNTWVPDQGGIKILARIRGTNGVWYVTPEVTGLTLARSGSYVRFYKPYNVPERAWARGDLPVVRIPVNIPSIANASSARAFLRLWNGIDVYGADHPTHYRRLNSYNFPEIGENHYFSDHLLNVPVGNLVAGTNTFSFYSSTTAHHGIEILWPGPMLMVRYGGTPSNNPPSITSHPQNQTVPVGQTATFSVGASGTPTLTYQWQKNGTNISGATTSSYTTPAVSTNDNGATFRCVVTNNYGTATSNSATLTVGGGGGNIAPTITQHPASLSRTVGQTAAFSVAASGTAPLSYQWQKNGQNIAGATNANYTTPPVALADNGAQFRCVVSNNYGVATSNAATLSVGTGGGGTGTNVLTNGSFESGTAGWVFYTNGSGSLATVAPGTDGALAARVMIATAGNNVQLYQYGISLEPNTQYVLRFDARSSVAKTIEISVQKHGSPYTNYGLLASAFDIQTSWDNYGVTFTTKGFSGAISDARFMIWLADVDAAGNQFFFDNVVLMKAGGGGTPGSVLTNGSFESGTSNWTFYTNGAGSFAAVAPGQNSATAARINISTPGSNVQLYQSGFSLMPGTSYVLSFNAYSNVPRTITVSVQKHVSPYNSYGLTARPFALTNSWQPFSATFTTSGFSGTATDTRLMFWFAAGDAAGHQYFIDNITLSPAAAGSASELATEAPAEVALGQPGISDIYPNPFNPSTNIRFVLAEPSEVTMKVYSILGQEVATLVNGARAAGLHSVVWDGRNSNGAQMGSGVYICRMTGAKESGEPIVSVKRMLLLK